MKAKDVRRILKMTKEELITLLHRLHISNPHHIDLELVRDLIKNTSNASSIP